MGQQEQQSAGPHNCDDQAWFDRSVCAEPCGSMHYYCGQCGRLLDACANDDSAAGETLGTASTGTTARTPAEDVSQEYGLRVDCERQGCPTPHGDNGYVLPRSLASEDVEAVNGHAVTFVVRDVVRTPWRDLASSTSPVKESSCG